MKNGFCCCRGLLPMPVFLEVAAARVHCPGVVAPHTRSTILRGSTYTAVELLCQGNLKAWGGAHKASCQTSNSTPPSKSTPAPTPGQSRRKGPSSSTAGCARNCVNRSMALWLGRADPCKPPKTRNKMSGRPSRTQKRIQKEIACVCAVTRTQLKVNIAMGVR